MTAAGLQQQAGVAGGGEFVLLIWTAEAAAAPGRRFDCRTATGALHLSRTSPVRMG
jgi:hypothetical protein